MSKTSRKAELKEAERLERQKRQLEQAKEMKKADRLAAIVAGGITGVVILALAIFLCLNSLFDNGYFMKKTISVSSENYEINNSMMSYFFYEEYRDFVNLNYSEISKMGLKSDKSLKKQTSYYKDGTWYDHFMNNAEKHVKQIVALAEDAKSNGVSLDETDKKFIDETIEKKISIAKSNDQSVLEYFSYLYGRGVTEKDIRACLKLEALAEKYLNTLRSDYSITDEEYENYYQSDINKYSSVDVMKYTFNYNEFADAAKGATSYDEYKSAVCNDLVKQYKENYDTDLEAVMVEMIFSNIGTSTYAYGDDKEIDGFAFKEGSKVGDVLSIEEDGKSVVICLVKTAYRSEYSTVNIRLAYFNNKTYGDASYAMKAANSSLESFSDTDKTSVDFAQLAKENSEDYDSAKSGGLYENLHRNIIDSAAEEWAFDTSRKAGDCEIVTGQEGYYLMYFEGVGKAAWKSDIFNENFNEFFEKEYKSLIETYKITSSSKNLKKISV